MQYYVWLPVYLMGCNSNTVPTGQTSILICIRLISKLRLSNLKFQNPFIPFVCLALIWEIYTHTNVFLCFLMHPVLLDAYIYLYILMGIHCYGLSKIFCKTVVINICHIHQFHFSKEPITKGLA